MEIEVEDSLVETSSTILQKIAVDSKITFERNLSNIVLVVVNLVP